MQSTNHEMIKSGPTTNHKLYLIKSANIKPDLIKQINLSPTIFDQINQPITGKILLINENCLGQIISNRSINQIGSSIKKYFKFIIHPIRNYLVCVKPKKYQMFINFSTSFLKLFYQASTCTLFTVYINMSHDS